MFYSIVIARSDDPLNTRHAVLSARVCNVFLYIVFGERYIFHISLFHFFQIFQDLHVSIRGCPYGYEMVRNVNFDFASLRWGKFETDRVN